MTARRGPCGPSPERLGRGAGGSGRPAFEVGEAVSGNPQRPVGEADPGELALVHRLDDDLGRDTEPAGGLGGPEDLAVAHATPPSSNPNLRPEGSDVGR